MVWPQVVFDMRRKLTGHQTFTFNSNTTLLFFPLNLYRKRHRVKINDNSRLTKLRVKERAFVTSHVNIYVRGKGVHRRTLSQCKFSFLYRVRIEIILLYCELSLINACCCRADATINSLRLRRRELIHRNPPSNIMH